MNRRLIGAILGIAAAATVGATERNPGNSAAVDALFKPWQTAGSPGCAVSVTKAQQLVFEGAYGNAVVTDRVPNTPATTFHVASVSKQFTAFAIYLLQADSKLSIKDDVRKYVPELHDFGRPIRIADLLHHTSGLRDQWSLLALAGRRLEDTIAQDDVLRAIFAQRELNFPTGSRFGYSNSNYTLLALVVERVSGQSFARFMAKRVFEPLGMTDTWIQDDFRVLHSGHAEPYGPGPGGLQHRSLPYSTYGATGVQTSVEDMARWAMNLDRPKVGMRGLVEAMMATTRDDTGRAVNYASGFETARYRGAATIEHSGTDPGYVADFLMFPAHRFAVTVLCNTEGPNPIELAHAIADIYLGGVLAPKTIVEHKPVVLDAKHLAGFAGTYQEEPGILFAVTLRDGKLFMQDRDALTAFGERDFFLANAPVTFGFPDGNTLVIHEPDHDRVARRIPTVAVPDLTPANMQDYAGAYYSPELNAVYNVAIREGALWLSGPLGDTAVRQQAAPLREPDAFYTESLAGALQFRRDDRQRVSEFALSNGRVIGLRFVKLRDGLPELVHDDAPPRVKASP